MSKQPEALRLAEIFDGAWYVASECAVDASEASAELRRLHALNGELLAMLKSLIESLVAGDVITVDPREAQEAIAQAEAA